MGRIKTTLAKRIGNKLMKEKPEVFTTDFAKNKELLEENAEMHSKKLRTVIAGYITRLAKMREKEGLA